MLEPSRHVRRVILVEDSPLVRRNLMEMLSSLPHVEVVAAEEGATTALHAIDVLKPEVVVLDIQIAEGSGMDVLRQVKQTYPQIQVVMLTNHSSSFYRAACLREGADFFLDKSSEFDQVGNILLNMPTA